MIIITGTNTALTDALWNTRQALYDAHDALDALDTRTALPISDAVDYFQAGELATAARYIHDAITASTDPTTQRHLVTACEQLAVARYLKTTETH